MPVKTANEGAGKETKPALDPETAAARRHNFGLGRAEILDGNIAYLEIRGFEEADGYEAAVANALRFLEFTDAIIIDLRRNHGGSVCASSSIARCGKRVIGALNSWRCRESGEALGLSVLPQLVGASLTSNPVSPMRTGV
ncbi:MAG: S41 family peptidase [Pseudomonadota bacterium]